MSRHISRMFRDIDEETFDDVYNDKIAIVNQKEILF